MTSISIHYAVGESGWADDQGNGTARLTNVPFLATDLMIDDLVRLAPAWPKCCTRLVAGEVLERRFPLLAQVQYEDVKDWSKLQSVMRGAGWRLEGARGPHKGDDGEPVPGIAFLAYTEGDVGPQMVAEAVGIEIGLFPKELGKRTEAPQQPPSRASGVVERLKAERKRRGR